MSDLTAPVALFIFNRPQLAERVFEVIAQARPGRLFVISDGPRSDHPADQELISQSTALIDRVD